MLSGKTSDEVFQTQHHNKNHFKVTLKHRTNASNEVEHKTKGNSPTKYQPNSV